MLGKRVHNSKSSSSYRLSDRNKDASIKSNSSKQDKELYEIELNASFPYVKPSENADLLPCYSDILKRTTDKGIGMNDLDQLQHELEKLLSVSVQRSRLLKYEQEYLEKIEDRHVKKIKLYDKPTSPKHRKTEEKIKAVKDFKHSHKLMKHLHEEVPKLEVPKVLLPKNDKYWLFIDSYCAAATADDIAYLDKLIEETQADLELRIPELGQHYTDSWNLDQETGKIFAYGDKKKPNKFITNNRLVNGDCLSNGVIFPIATSLLEEKLNKIEEKCKDNGVNGIKAINNSMCFDKRLRKELAAMGVLELDDKNFKGRAFNLDDEVVREIKQCHRELCELNVSNVKELNRLKHLINKDIARQEKLRKLDEVDNKIMKVYIELLTSTTKKESLELEAAKLLKLQRQYHQESMQV